MKILNALEGYGGKFTESQINEFLTRKLNLQLGTVDNKGEPNINPVWFLHEGEKLYVATPKKSKKAQNILQNNTIYFSIDDETFPYKGVKGKGDVDFLEDLESKTDIAEKIIIKYMGNLENDIGKFILNQINEGNQAILEITPKYYSAWSFET